MSSKGPTPGEDRPSGGNFALQLWVIAILLALVELTWFWAARIYS